MYDSPYIESVRIMHKRIITEFKDKVHNTLIELESGFDDVMAVMSLSLKY
jgi:hypothetical protein